MQEEEITKTLLEKDLITPQQFESITNYRALKLFSLHTELKICLYASVLLFTSGIGIIIYDNISSVGHIIILLLLGLTIGLCFYLSFKNAPKFQKVETIFDNPVFSYLSLAGSMLTCTFIGYLQFQYDFFGMHYGLATLIPTLICFFSAYYFDNTNILTLAITGLTAYVGFSVAPQDLLNNAFILDEKLSFSAVLLGLSFVLWTIYSTRLKLKEHFNFIFLTFALHIISIVAISNMLIFYNNSWLIFTPILAISSFYFYKISGELKAISLYVFMIIYAYIGINSLLFRVLENIYFFDFWELLVLILPAYFIGSIVLFVRLIKKFNQKKAS